MKLDLGGKVDPWGGLWTNVGVSLRISFRGVIGDSVPIGLMDVLMGISRYSLGDSLRRRS